MKEKSAGTAGVTVAPTYEEFMGLSGYDLAMVTAEVSSDLETPISAFMKLRDGSSCFLLESAESDQMWGRYSFLGFDPTLLLSLERGEVAFSGGAGERKPSAEPVRAVFDEVERRRVFLPFDGMPFEGGAVGYFGYGVLEHLEKVSFSKRASTPEMVFMFPGRVVVFDHLRSRVRLCVMIDVARDAAGRKAAYESAGRGIASMVEQLEKPLPLDSGIRLTGTDGDDFEGVESNLTRAEYERMVDSAREYILAGDAFQIVCSQRFSVETQADPLSVYRHLRSENPSPYMFYLELPGMTLVGSSPEAMVTNRAGRAVIRPIAGTRPRGADASADAALSDELRADEKERAEHIMLVDLARNDLGRVCEPGTVRVTSLMDVERYSHVIHMVSEVEGRLKAGCGNYELLRASFPAGTVVGAPKVRASEIIDELEKDGRGPYAGAVGYVSYSGDMDTCIAIRTVLFSYGVATVQAGGGLVADSDPSDEYNESRNKARAVLRAVKAAGRMER